MTMTYMTKIAIDHQELLKAMSVIYSTRYKKKRDKTHDLKTACERVKDGKIIINNLYE